MASKRGSDEDIEGPSYKMSKRDDDDDGSKGGRSGRIRKKSAKVLEMEEFEEIEKKQFTKKAEPKGKSPASLPAAGPKKGKMKMAAEEAGFGGRLGVVTSEGASAGFSLTEVAQGSAPTSPVKTSAKQAMVGKVKEGHGQGSVIKLLLSSPAIPTSPSVSAKVMSKTAPSSAMGSPVIAAASPPQPPPPASSVPVKKVKIKAEPAVISSMLMTQEDMTMPTSIKGELIDSESAHLLLASSLQGHDDPMLSAQPMAAIKSEQGMTGSSAETLNSLKLKLLMSPKDGQAIAAVSPTSMAETSLFPNPDETDGAVKTSTPATARKKAAPRKKKAPSEKTKKGGTASKTASEQMPNLAALVSMPKGGLKAAKEEHSMSLSDAIDTSLSDASLDMSSIVESALDMEEEAALVIAEGTVSASSKNKKKRSSGAGTKKKKKEKVDLDSAGFESDEAMMTVPPEGDIAALAAKVQRSAGTLGGKKKLSKKSQELLDMQDPKKRPTRRAPTAYMLYCNSQRPKVVSESPGIDFAQISRTLGIMWQCLSKKEKMMWRRKSKKIAGKGSTLISTGKLGHKKNADHTSPTAAPASATAAHPPARTPAAGKAPKTHGAPVGSGDDTPQSPVKGFGIEPIDIAAHLKLLGESLSIIGNRLQEHKGLIAVQGSLSVLLDSMLCACGPLLALTHQVPGLDGCSEATHARTLDMVAYFMPGL